MTQKIDDAADAIAEFTIEKMPDTSSMTSAVKGMFSKFVGNENENDEEGEENEDKGNVEGEKEEQNEQVLDDNKNESKEDVQIKSNVNADNNKL